ncbi:MAG TPA: hypothetical protein VKU44_05615 [Terriglobia bacterium]|jgi:hypothetical protein|nr:hypothetical protein [Terriglobia bacterium]
MAGVWRRNREGPAICGAESSPMTNLEKEDRSKAAVSGVDGVDGVDAVIRKTNLAKFYIGATLVLLR